MADRKFRFSDSKTLQLHHWKRNFIWAFLQLC